MQTDGLAQGCSNSSVLAVELLQSRTNCKLSIYCLNDLFLKAIYNMNSLVHDQK